MRSFGRGGVILCILGCEAYLSLMNLIGGVGDLGFSRNEGLSNF